MALLVACTCACWVGWFLLGQARLLRRAIARAVVFPARRYPLTDGDRGRDFVAPGAARILPNESTQEAVYVTDPARRPIRRRAIRRHAVSPPPPITF